VLTKLVDEPITTPSAPGKKEGMTNRAGNEERIKNKPMKPNTAGFNSSHPFEFW
jgi:hypothetical protein